MMSNTCFVFFFASLLDLISGGPSKHASTVGFPDRYAVDGVIILPYADIHETFTAYYDKRENRSRIDYYGDLVQTIQRGDQVINGGNDDDIIGVSYKLAYNVDEEGLPNRVCFQVNGSDVNPVKAQSALPDLTGFTYFGQESCPKYGSEDPGSNMCELWTLTNTVGERINKYRFWLKRDKVGRAIPVHYDMDGFNSLFGSHYDKYQISYKNYRLQLDDSIFDIPDNLTCTGFPGPGFDHVRSSNPMAELINDEETRESFVESKFMEFKKIHGKEYQNLTEEELRKSHFRHNHRFIESSNRKNLHFKLKINHMADWSVEEFKVLRGRLFSNVKYNGGHPFQKPKVDRPKSLDWRKLGAVTPVKDQAICGSCWSFGTIGTIEGVNFVKTGRLIRLSEQQLIDCSWNEGDNGCDGGEDFRAYKYIMKVGGLSTNEDYGYYLGQDGRCHDRDVDKVVQLKGFVNVTSYDSDALELALFKHGPVTVAIDASQRTFSFYSHGVYYDPECGSKPDDLDHQVLAVGYGTLYGKKYWLIKNSWSTYWGDKGYILMAQKNNNCGVMTSPTYPII